MSTTTRAALAALLAACLLGVLDGRADDAPLPAKPPVWKTMDRVEFWAAITSDGKYVGVLEQQTRDVVVYRRDTGKEHFRVPQIRLFFFAFTPDGKSLVTLANRQTKADAFVSVAVVWDVATGKRARDFEISEVGAPVLMPGPYLVTDKAFIDWDRRDRTSRAIDLATGKVLGDFGDQNQIAVKKAVSRDGKWLLTAGGEKNKTELRLWDVEKRKLARVLHDHGRDKVVGLAISRDGKLCVSAARSVKGARTVWLFDAEKGELLKKLPPLMARVDSVHFGRDDETVVVTGEGAFDGVQVWDWRTDTDVRGAPEGGIREYFGTYHDKKWRAGDALGCGMTDDGVLLTRTSGRELRLWFDGPKK